jgi:hypothetical protein
MFSRRIRPPWTGRFHTAVFAASVLAEAFLDRQEQRTAVVFHGITFEVAAILFNLIWWHARHDRRLLTTTH